MNRAQRRYPCRVASIDIGTNSVRLLVAEVEAEGGLRRLYMDRRITRLGEGLQRFGVLSQEAVRRTREALLAFSHALEDWCVQRTLAGATSAVRESRNGEAFVQMLEKEMSIPIRVLSGEEEARWTALGVEKRWIHPPSRWTLLDIGGGSTEMVDVENGRVRKTLSLPIGMVKLTEEAILGDPPTKEELTACRRKAGGLIGECLRGDRAAGGYSRPSVVGTAGTITTLAALDLGLEVYDSGKIDGHILRREAVHSWCNRLGAMTSEERARLPGMESGREDVILAGSILLEEVMEALGTETVEVTDFGLLEGIAVVAAREAEADPTGAAAEGRSPIAEPSSPRPV
jgi:exopolyphosphatase/guanosine-5'-triphosphate,3'-diphosphate pyrophosphatase